MEFCQVWCVNTPVHCVLWHRWVNIEQGAKFEEVSCYFTTIVMRIFFVLLSNVYLHSQDFRCKFRIEYAKPGWGFLWLWEPIFLIKAQRRWQGWQTSPSRVILVISPALPLVGTSWLHVCTSDLFPWSHKPLSQKDAAVGQTQAFYISLKTSATAKCLRVSEF